MIYLTVTAHPDDEILGCGGTIIEHIKKRDQVGIVIMSEGITSRDEKRNFKKRKKEIYQLSNVSKIIANKLKVKFIKLFSFPDNRLDSVDLLDIVKNIEKVIKKFKPDSTIVATPDHTQYKILLVQKLLAFQGFYQQLLLNVWYLGAFLGKYCTA